MYKCPICGCAEETCPYPTASGENWLYCPNCDDYRLQSDWIEIEHRQADADWADLKQTEETLRTGMY